MGDLFAWLFSFIVLIFLLAILGYQLMCLVDLEFDYINPYDSTSRINVVVLPEFIAQGVLCFIHLISGHWLIFLLSLPCLYYNVQIYMKRQHLVDVTEIYNNLKLEKRRRAVKIAYLIFLFIVSLFWVVWSVGQLYG